MNKSDTAHAQPSGMHELNKLVEEFIKRLNAIESNADLLKEEKKELLEEYSDRLDVKTLAHAMRIAKIRQASKDVDVLDNFIEILEKY